MGQMDGDKHKGIITAMTCTHLAMFMLDVEASIQYSDAHDSKWNDLRGGWLRDVRACIDPVEQMIFMYDIKDQLKYLTQDSSGAVHHNFAALNEAINTDQHRAPCKQWEE